MVRTRTCRAVSLLIALLLCAAALVACERPDPMARLGIRTAQVDGAGKVTVTVSLDTESLAAHRGEKAYLYELLPGETLSEAQAKDPLASKKISSEMTFTFSLSEEETTRLYSTFAACYEDGTPIGSDPVRVGNPATLAVNREIFPWASSPKGLTNAELGDTALLECMHVMETLSLSALMNGTGQFSFGGEVYPTSNEHLVRLDRRIRAASEAGMQASLSLAIDVPVSQKQLVATLDMLAQRYTCGENGTVTALFLSLSRDCCDELGAVRAAQLALGSRVANARVYVIAEGRTQAETRAFFKDLGEGLSDAPDLRWGAALSPVMGDKAPWLESAEGDAVTVSAIPSLAHFLLDSRNGAGCSFFAVTGLSYSAADADLQAASYAYAYRVAAEAGASLIYYRDHFHESTGLRAADGSARRVTSLFAEIDEGLSPSDRLLCETVIGEAWNPDGVDKLCSRREVTGVANVGANDLTQKPLFSFADGSVEDFRGVGSVSTPATVLSQGWDEQVLHVWLDPQAKSGGGVRRVMTSAEPLKDATSLTVLFLTQAEGADACTVALSLEGMSTDGKRLTYRSDTQASTGSWQSATFQIGAFLAEADLSAPCVITLTTHPTADGADYTEEYSLWVHDVSLYLPPENFGAWLPIAITLVCVAAVLVSVLLLYRRASARRSRGRR